MFFPYEKKIFFRFSESTYWKTCFNEKIFFEFFHIFTSDARGGSMQSKILFAFFRSSESTYRKTCFYEKNFFLIYFYIFVSDPPILRGEEVHAKKKFFFAFFFVFLNLHIEKHVFMKKKFFEFFWPWWPLPITPCHYPLLFENPQNYCWWLTYRVLAFIWNKPEVSTTLRSGWAIDPASRPASQPSERPYKRPFSYFLKNALKRPKNVPLVQKFLYFFKKPSPAGFRANLRFQGLFPVFSVRLSWNLT